MPLAVLPVARVLLAVAVDDRTLPWNLPDEMEPSYCIVVVGASAATMAAIYCWVCGFAAVDEALPACFDDAL